METVSIKHSDLFTGRVSRVEISPHHMEMLLSSAARPYRVIEGVPEGATLIHASVDYRRWGNLTLVFEHESFEELTTPSVPPQIVVMLEILREDK